MKYFPDNSNYSLKEFLSSYSATLSNVLDEIDEDKLNQTFKVISKAIKSHNTIFTCGNGGSSSIAEHLVCDFVKGSSTDSIIDPKVIPLLSTPLITAVANDIDYEEIFSYQLKKYATKQDVLLSVSSSGNSPNIVKAIKKAKELGMLTVSLVGFDGGRAKEISDHVLHIKSHNYGICEDAHHVLMHLLSQYLRLQNIDDDQKLGNVKF